MHTKRFWAFLCKRAERYFYLLVWNAARTLESILRSGPSCGLESISLLGPSCAPGSILRSGVHPARSCPLIALGSILRSRVDPAIWHGACDLGVCRAICFFGFAPFFGTIVLAGREWVRSESDSSKLRFWEIWNNPGAQSYRFFSYRLWHLGWSPSPPLESITRSRVHPPLSGPSCALEPILRSRVHPPLSGPSCGLESILRSGVHCAL